MKMAELVTEALLFIGPSYVANAAPLLFGGGRPLDGGRNFVDGNPIFGSHKTVRGDDPRYARWLMPVYDGGG
jgi:CDP-2,3-bis-(O-geranylgeranyl)-sn-glycerol synthase